MNLARLPCVRQHQVNLGHSSSHTAENPDTHESFLVLPPQVMCFGQGLYRLDKQQLYRSKLEQLGTCGLVTCVSNESSRV